MDGEDFIKLKNLFNQRKESSESLAFVVQWESHDSQLMSKVGNDGAERWEHYLRCNLLTHLGAVEFHLMLHMSVFHVPHE